MVLIILAVISIGVIFGDGGIIAREEQASEGDKAETVNIASQTIGYGSNARTLVEMYDAGELKIGDYINFPNPTSGIVTALGTQTGMPNFKDRGFTVADENLNQVYNVANNQLNWRILGKDSSGGLKLIAGSPMKKETTKNDPYLHMYGAKAYTEGINILNNIASLYANEYTVETRSININDINEITGIRTSDKIKEVNLDYYYYDDRNQYGDVYSFENHYTPESWLNGKIKTTVTGTVDGYFYAINATEDGMPTAQVADTRIYNMMFDNVEFMDGKAYWLASCSVRMYSSDVGFGPGAVDFNSDFVGVGTVVDLFNSDGSEYHSGFAVRPVVVLKSDVTEEDMQKIPDQIEETWNYGG